MTAFKIPARPIRQKGERHVKAKLRQESARHLDFVRGLPCLLTGESGCDPHHLLRLPFEARGMAMRSDDCWTIPLTRRMHDALHDSGDEIVFLGARGIYGPAVASLLWQLSGRQEAAERALSRLLDLVRLHRITEPLRRIGQ